MGKSSLKRTPFLIAIISVAFVGGLFTAAYAGPILPTITLAGNVVVTDDLTVDTDTLVVDSTNDRVGIGTTSPASALHILSASPTISLDDTDSAVLGGFIDFQEGGARVANIVWNSDINKLFIETQPSGTRAIVIDSAGKVGIGTSAPTEELEVAGNIIGTPIVGRWAPNSSTSGFGNVIFDIQHLNTNSAYFGFTATQDHIKILKSGYYMISVNVMKTNLSVGERGDWSLEKRNSNGGTILDVLCKPILFASGAFESNSCTGISFFNANERVVLRNTDSGNDIYGDTSGDFTSIMIQRLN